jgi:hypothetical protein
MRTRWKNSNGKYTEPKGQHSCGDHTLQYFETSQITLEVCSSRRPASFPSAYARKKRDLVHNFKKQKYESQFGQQTKYTASRARFYASSHAIIVDVHPLH